MKSGVCRNSSDDGPKNIEGSELTTTISEKICKPTAGIRGSFARTVGWTPGRSRNAEAIRVKWIDSPVGSLILGATDEALCLLEFVDPGGSQAQVRRLRHRFDRPIVPGTNKWIAQATEELSQYFSGALRQFRVPIVYPGTDFQQSVWRRLLRIPYGRTICYEQLAADIGHHGAQRAVGTANGKNRIAIIIPCHRVVNKSGQLGGYGGGLWRKQFLLDLEQGRLHCTQPTEAGGSVRARRRSNRAHEPAQSGSGGLGRRRERRCL